MTLEELVNQVIINSQNTELLKEKMLEITEIIQEIVYEIKELKGGVNNGQPQDQ